MVQASEQPAGARPRVIVIVRDPGKAGDARRPGTGAIPIGAAAAALEAATPPSKTFKKPVDDRPTGKFEEAQVAEAAPVATAAPPEAAAPPARPAIPIKEERPTERIRKEQKKREPEDERLVAAVIMLVSGGAPGPLDDFLGRTLLYRAARAALVAGAPRLVLVGNPPEELRRQLHEEAYAGFGGKPVEMRLGDPVVRDFGRGRVLVLDGAALHDAASVRKLARHEGPATAMLLSRQGGGLRVVTDGGKVKQLGVEVQGADGILSGAASVPVEHFERITRMGERAALEELGQAELLVGVHAARNYGQQFRSKEEFERARRDSFDALAASGPSGSFDDVLGRPVSRALTMWMLHRQAWTSTRVSLLAGVLALVGAFALAAAGSIDGLAGRLVALLSGLFLIGSAIFDRVDGELARLRLDEDEEARYLDFGLDHLTQAVVAMALAHHVHVTGALEAAAKRIPQLGPLLHQHEVQPVQLGFVAVLGVIILMCVLLWRGAPRPGSTGLRRLADALAGFYSSRDYFYLLTIAAAVNCVPFLGAAGVMGLFLLLSVALVHLLWLGLLALSIVAPPLPEED